MFTKKLSAKALTVAGATALMLGAMSGTQAALPQTADLNVTATVVTNCTISTTAVAFGNYDGVSTNASTALDGQGKVTVKCTSGAAVNVALGQGANFAAASRRMKNGTSFLTYKLFTDGTRATEWEGATTVPHTGTGAAVDLDVFGSVDAGQVVPAGAYADLVVATVDL
jgi:spore coat protein U-like protein